MVKMQWTAKGASVEDLGPIGNAVLNATELPRNPDWRLTLSYSFLVWVDTSVLEKAKLACGRTHEFFAMFHDVEKEGMVYIGWYGPDREAGAAAIAPVVEALDKFRRRPRKDSNGNQEVDRVSQLDSEIRGDGESGERAGEGIGESAKESVSREDQIRRARYGY